MIPLCEKDGLFPVPRRFAFEWIDYHHELQSSRIIGWTAEVFASHCHDLQKVKTMADDVRKMIEGLSPFIQKHTAAVCPSCDRVCCINRHSYHEQQDLVLLYALGAEPPDYRNVDASAPCRFLDEYGCTVARSYRPYRCTWFFCLPLLEHIRLVPSKDYREFIRRLEALTLRREEMLKEFANAVEKIATLK